MSETTPPLVFVAEHGEPDLDVAGAAIQTHFVVTAIMVQPSDAAAVRRVLDEVRQRDRRKGELRSPLLLKNLQRYRRVLEELDEAPFRFYGVVVDKRELQQSTTRPFREAFVESLSGVLYRKLFASFPNLQVVTDSSRRDSFMADFEQYLGSHHRDTLFDRPRVTFVERSDEPLLQLAELLGGALVRAYETSQGVAEDSLGVLRSKRALLIDEWPVRHRPASGTGSLVLGDPADDDLARLSVARAEEFLQRREPAFDEDVRAQVLALRKLLFEYRFVDPRAYVSAAVLRETLATFDQSTSDQWLRSSVIARLRDAGVLIASSARGYKIPCCVADVIDFVERTDTVVHPMLNRIARARDEVLSLTGGRVDVLADDRFVLLRTAVDAIRARGASDDRES